MSATPSVVVLRQDLSGSNPSLLVERYAPLANGKSVKRQERVYWHKPEDGDTYVRLLVPRRGIWWVRNR